MPLSQDAGKGSDRLIEAFDSGVLEFFQKLHTPVLTEILKFFTMIGEAGMIWIVVGLILFVMKRTRKYGCIVLLALLMCLLLGNGLLKNLIARPRPCWRHPEVEMLIQIPQDYSFPSGHTFSSFAAAVSLFYWKKTYGYVAFAVAVTIALSRLYFFVHYPTDILGGALIGTVFALISIWIIEKAAVKNNLEWRK